MWTEWKAAVRALRALFYQPSTDAWEAAKFRAMGTQSSISQFVHADEASEYICYALLIRIKLEVSKLKRINHNFIICILLTNFMVHLITAIYSS